MLLVKTKIDKSSIEGIGLFAEQFIPKETIIWEYHPLLDRKFTQDEFDMFTGLKKEYLERYCFKFNNCYYLCFDNDRFVNHSNNPNCYSSEYSDKFIGYTKALRDIEIGEELTDNYNEFGLNDMDKLYHGNKGF